MPALCRIASCTIACLTACPRSCPSCLRPYKWTSMALKRCDLRQTQLAKAAPKLGLLTEHPRKSRSRAISIRTFTNYKCEGNAMTTKQIPGEANENQRNNSYQPQSFLPPPENLQSAKWPTALPRSQAHYLLSGQVPALRSACDWFIMTAAAQLAISHPHACIEQHHCKAVSINEQTN
jgi:hypothetical protein